LTKCCVPDPHRKQHRLCSLTQPWMNHHPLRKLGIFLLPQEHDPLDLSPSQHPHSLSGVTESQNIDAGPPAPSGANLSPIKGHLLLEAVAEAVTAPFTPECTNGAAAAVVSSASWEVCATSSPVATNLPPALPPVDKKLMSLPSPDPRGHQRSGLECHLLGPLQGSQGMTHNHHTTGALQIWIFSGILQNEPNNRN
jgi:hypothetical protein